MATLTRRSSLTSRGSTRAWRRTRAAVLARDGRRCRYCGKWANTVDHVVPRARGGTDQPSNLVAACWPCNRDKGASIVGGVGLLSAVRAGHASVPASPSAL